MIRDLILRHSPTSNSSYSAFVAHLTSGFTAQGPYVTSTSLYTLGGDIGSCWGSSWGHWYTTDSYAEILALHAFPDRATYLRCLSSAPMVAFSQVSYAGEVSTTGRSRNGHSTSSYPEWPCNQIEEFLYFDPLSGPKKMNPRQMTGPQPYTW